MARESALLLESFLRASLRSASAEFSSLVGEFVPKCDDVSCAAGKVELSLLGASLQHRVLLLLLLLLLHAAALRMAATTTMV